MDTTKRKPSVQKAILKLNEVGKPETFSTLPVFFRDYPEWETKRYNIETYLSRKKIAYQAVGFTLQRIEVKK